MPDQFERLRSQLAGRYTIERELGRGGAAIVYLAHDVKHERKVALKVLQPELALAVRTERFVREIQLTARLNHPHILTLIDSGQADGMPFYVMPYVEGESLRDLLNREKHLSIESAISITRDVVSALEYAHAQGIVHRDIKPENILLAHGGKAVVADFGIARALSVAAETAVTESGIAVGTPAYMSPEQGTGAADSRSDIYSLGCVLYEMLTGRPPFTGTTAQEIIRRHTLDPVPTVRAVRPSVSRRLEETITKSLAKHPADRFATASGFVRALEIASPAAFRPRVGPRALVSAAVALVLAGLIVVWRTVQANTPPPDSLAVLPCTSLQTDSGSAFQSDGITEDLIDKLLGFSGLQVPGYASSMRFKGRNNPAAAADSLRVATVLECTVRRVGSQLSLHASLIKANGLALWGHTYRTEVKSADDIYALEDSVALAVARQMQVTHAGQGAEILRPTGTKSVAAYDLYKRGRQYWWTRDPDAMDQAVKLFTEAIKLDSSYALAWSGLADASLYAGQIKGTVSVADAMARAEAFAVKAVALDSQLAEAHISLAKALSNAGGREDFPAAEGEFKIGLRLNPRYALGHSWYGMMLIRWPRNQRYDEGIHESRMAVALEPLSAALYNNLGLTLNGTARPDEAVVALRRAIELDPTWSIPYQLLGAALSALRRNDEAIKYGREAVRLDPRSGANHQGLANSLASAGLYTEALAELDSAAARSMGTPNVGVIVLGQIGRVHALMGDTITAWQLLRQLEQRRPTAAVWRAKTLIYLGLGKRDEAAGAFARADSIGGNWGARILGAEFDLIRGDRRFKASMTKKRGGP